MGLILDIEGEVRAEARRESFVLYDGFGAGFSLELAWDRLPHLKRALLALEEYTRRKGMDLGPRSPPGRQG